MAVLRSTRLRLNEVQSALAAGLGDHEEGIDFLVMEYMDGGATIAARLGAPSNQ
jgi:hypothetical protein